ncbi:MAG TPA: MaoC family dehydratase [Pseudonocardiaceae bacterium]|nr:MaoC family dehydratase [Pseudonocardiaceae bacterium]
MIRFTDPMAFAGAVGTSLGASNWHLMDQPTIDRFAEATFDHQWIHTDPARAAEGPFGRPVAHGFLTLSLLPALLTEIFQVAGVDVIVNRGLNRLRFNAPVRVGRRIRAVAHLLSARRRPRGFWEAVLSVVVELEDDEPACVAELVLLLATADDG